MLDGSRRRRETEADPKSPGIALWRRRETDKDGTHGQEQDRQQITASNGRNMSGPCVPPGAKRFNFSNWFIPFTNWPARFDKWKESLQSFINTYMMSRVMLCLWVEERKRPSRGVYNNVLNVTVFDASKQITRRIHFQNPTKDTASKYTFFFLGNLLCAKTKKNVKLTRV